jgi:hypothetical protein
MSSNNSNSNQLEIKNSETSRSGFTESKCKLFYFKSYQLVHEYLLNEFNKRNDLKVAKDKIDNIGKSAHSDKEYNMIYRFKYES